MAASMTSYLQKKLLDHTLGIASFTMPTTAYLSIHTASPGEAGSHANEIAGSGYARQAITASMSATDSTSGLSTNTLLITVTPSGSWGTGTYLGVEDAVSGGNMLLYGPLDQAETFVSGTPFQLAAGQLNITFA